MKKLLIVPSLVTILAMMATTVLAQEPDPGTGTSFGAVQNVDKSGNASFRQDFYDMDGNLDAYREKQDVVYGGTMGLTTNDTPDAPLSVQLPAGWVGSSVVSSDREAAAVVLIQWFNGSIGADGITTADYVGVTAPGNDIFCPSVGKRPYEATQIVVMNTTAAAVSDVSISFKDRNGADAGTAMTNINISANSQKTFSLFDAAFALPANFLGAARVESAGGTPLAVVAVTHWGYATGAFGSFAYNCLSTDAGATTLYGPKVQRRAPSWNDGNWLDESGVVVVNTEGTAASARVEFYDREGNFGGVFTDTVPAYSARGYNTRWIGNADQTVIEGLIGLGTAAQPEWQGGVVVRSVGAGAEKLVGVIKQAYATSEWAGGYTMLSDADAGTVWYFPLTYRRGFSRPWTDYSGIVCQNISAVSVAPEVTFVNRADDATASFVDATPFGQYISHGYNTRYGGNQPAAWFGDMSSGAIGNNLANNFLGAAFVEVAAGQIVCIQETWAEEVYSDGAFLTGGDANLNNAYGQ